MACCKIDDAVASANKSIAMFANENAYAASMKCSKLPEGATGSATEHCSSSGSSTIVKGSTIVKQSGSSSTDDETNTAGPETASGVYHTIVTSRRSTLELLESEDQSANSCACIRKRKQAIITFIVMLFIKALVAVIMLLVVAKPAFLGFKHVSTSVTTVAAERKMVEVFGAKRLSLDSRLNSLMVFNTIIKSSASNISTARNFFEVPQSPSNNTLYWMNLAIEANGINLQANVRVAGSHLVIYRVHQNTASEETISRCGVVKLRAGTQVSVSSQFATNVAYWSVFQLDNLMSPLVAFFVAVSTSLSNPGLVIFDTIFVNEGNGWIYNDHRFVAPHSGIYLFSVTCSTAQQRNTLIKMNVNDESFIVGQSGNGQADLTSVTRPLTLTAESTVSVALDGIPKFVSDSATYPISFSGFYYAPASAKIVWSVARTKPVTTDHPEDPMPFDKISINIGNVWNDTASASVITHAGLYYVQATINTLSTGRGMLNVKVNGVKQFEVKSLAINYKVDQTRSNGAILRLAEGDRVTVEQPKLDSGSIGLSHSMGITSFFGLLILPE